MNIKRSLQLVLCIGLILCILSGCAERTPQTTAGFTQTMEGLGFTVQSLSLDEEEKARANAIVDAQGEHYDIVLYELVDTRVGLEVFNNCKEEISEEHSTITLSKSITVGTFSYYHCTAGGIFYLVSRIDNTVLYSEADADYKDEIIGIAEQLGYK